LSEPPVVSNDTVFSWTDLDRKTTDTVRVLAADSVQKVGNGHPGTAMSLAPVATLLFQKHLRHDPADPQWVGRDRFVLSPGHSSLTLYIQLYLSGYGSSSPTSRPFRTWGSLTPGHPEHGHTIGVETTTGPLGQGLANAVGMAMAARYERGLFDPDAAAGASPFDHTIYAIASDGDLEEGVTSEASSLAGHPEARQPRRHLRRQPHLDRGRHQGRVHRGRAQALRGLRLAHPVGRVDDRGRLRRGRRGAAQGDRRGRAGDRPAVDHQAAHDHRLARAARAEHREGARLGARRRRGRPPRSSWASTRRRTSRSPRASCRTPARSAPAAPRRTPSGTRASRPGARPTRSAPRTSTGSRSASCPRAGTRSSRPSPPGKDVATRKASEAAIQAIAEQLPEFWGGSADLAGSTNTTIKGGLSFLPYYEEGGDFGGSSPYGRILHFGIREHGMGAILNGIALHGNTRVFGATFLQFSDYMRPAVRLASMMQAPVTYVWTHDSIGLGEDGPTHQPVEHYAALRAIPGFHFVRPADANETVAAWKATLEQRGPVGLALTRQNVPVFDHDALGSALPVFEGVKRGGYVLAEATGGVPKVILIGTGSEVQLAVEARERLEASGVPTRVVSMPCTEWFEAQDAGYRESVLPLAVKARVAVEAGIAQSWYRYVGDAGRIVSLEHYGASADFKTLYTEFGVTADAVESAARESLAAAEA
jgi:transketolase